MSLIISLMKLNEIGLLSFANTLIWPKALPIWNLLSNLTGVLTAVNRNIIKLNTVLALMIKIILIVFSRGPFSQKNDHKILFLSDMWLNNEFNVVKCG